MRKPSLTRALAACAAIVLGMLWWTNFCFAELRWISHDEICGKYLNSLPRGYLTEASRCVFEKPAFGAAFYVSPTALAPHLYPQTQWGDLLTLFDRCGGHMRFPH